MAQTIALFIARSPERHLVLFQFWPGALHEMDVEALVLPGDESAPATQAALAALGLTGDHLVAQALSETTVERAGYLALDNAAQSPTIRHLFFTPPFTGKNEADTRDAAYRLTRSLFDRATEHGVINLGFALLDERGDSSGLATRYVCAKAMTQAMDDLVEGGVSTTVCRALLGGPGVSLEFLRQVSR